MQSATEVEKKQEETLVPAATLKEMTMTKEGLFDQQKASLLENLMSSMVKIATEQGGTNYGAQLHPDFDANMFVQITDRLKGLGYVVTSETKDDAKLGKFILLNISWT